MMTITTPTDIDPRFGMTPHPVIHTRTYTKLFLTCLNDEAHQKTCGYWYTVTHDAAYPHTAFATREGLLAWLNRFGLHLTQAMPAHGSIGFQSIAGAYRTASHCSYDAFYSLAGEHIRTMSNGRYTLGIITKDDDGLYTLHTLNPNMHYRPEYDHAESRALGF